MKTRIEKDSMGDIEVPADALYSAQTQRAVNNFKISGLTLPEGFIKALALVKYCAAQANLKLDNIEADKAKAIQDAALTIYDGRWLDQFPVDVFQTGSGTSSNMNANEVIANLARRESNIDIHPNDDVNRGQSSNDVIPTTIAVSSALAVAEQLLPAAEHLIDSIRHKAGQLSHVVKTGRTHLMDAMPLTMAQELESWAQQLQLSVDQIKQLQPALQRLSQGGTAIGTGINAPQGFAEAFNDALSDFTELSFTAHDCLFAGIAGQETSLLLSGHLNTLAATLMKISNDLRWMNSGPLAGLGEISLTALQPGSSIMPGKVNPVIPEAVTMVVAQVSGNHSTITTAAQAGNFQLNVMLPVIAYNLLQSIELLSNSCHALADQAIADFSVNEEQIEHALAKNPILVTALNPVIGYNKAADIAKRAYKEKRAIIDVAEEMTDLSRQRLSELLDPKKLTQGGLSDD
ncbi:fumarate hydratase [Idiomarina xiamenensis 10-D-4]|uniref:Fumarate hydratase class II n=2 Tax=Idiomarina xiamenensis TaxID=1207041 RepID=K2KYL3_9GAMM|nr:fumarate hydratase [Idiomarina xiamenensis 10-D-4]